MFHIFLPNIMDNESGVNLDASSSYPVPTVEEGTNTMAAVNKLLADIEQRQAERLQRPNASSKSVISKSVIQQKLWKCQFECGKVFTRKQYMERHVSLMHFKTEKVQCKMCGKNLSTSSGLKNHMLRHTTVGRLVCLICVKKRSSELSIMRNHLLVKHGISCKHLLFQKLMYEMSLKEVAIEGGVSTRGRKKKGGTSANDKEALDKKIKNLSTSVLRELHVLEQQVTSESRVPTAE